MKWLDVYAFIQDNINVNILYYTIWAYTPVLAHNQIDWDNKTCQQRSTISHLHGSGSASFDFFFFLLITLFTNKLGFPMHTLSVIWQLHYALCMLLPWQELFLTGTCSQPCSPMMLLATLNIYEATYIGKFYHFCTACTCVQNNYYAYIFQHMFHLGLKVIN